MAGLLGRIKCKLGAHDSRFIWARDLLGPSAPNRAIIEACARCGGRYAVFDSGKRHDIGTNAAFESVLKSRGLA